jgi:MFS family permease
MTTTTPERGVPAAAHSAATAASNSRTAATAAPNSRTAAASGLSRTFSSFSNRQFLVLWSGMLASFLAMNMQQVARGYLAYEIGGTASTLGLVTLGWGIPQLLLAPLGGVIADRVPRRNLLIATQSVVGFSTLLNAILISLGHIQVWHLVAIGVMQGSAFAFNMPARQALIPEIVGREALANAIAINNAGMNLTRILGPVLAGIFIGIPFIGNAGAFYFMAACYLVVLATLFSIRPVQPQAPETRRGNLLAELTVGMRYIWHDRTLLSLILLGFVPVMLAMPYQSLMPVFAKRSFNAGSEGLGVLMGAAGVGALAGSLVVAYFSQSQGKSKLQLGAGIAFGAALVLFALAPSFPVGVACMLLVGAANNIYMALNNTLLLTNCESSMHGRVMSVYIMSFSFQPLSTMPISALADVIGPQATVGIAGAATALIIAAVAAFVPSLRKVA